MATSTAPKAIYLFGQDVPDGVHLSFNLVSGDRVNMLITDSDVVKLCENLVRCMARRIEQQKMQIIALDK
jgi:hypothetical protein